MKKILLLSTYDDLMVKMHNVFQIMKNATCCRSKQGDR
jgi:hypothetical protein